ncbi:hypothetical protein CIRG_06366 [Coccidioides immitis RMSCC 2394]|uniref:Uncharacterized protein n=1 Tax=Coccidioides immitis RMSCC 2394 TaxID=404692 RepID=A0A0J6YGE0_COCIT|nr:hypothetical protein CIRG_06366 [Coccidioides immitis RMSCC 2394]
MPVDSGTLIGETEYCLNPIEEFFAELKAYIKKNWSLYEKYPNKFENAEHD